MFKPGVIIFIFFLLLSSCKPSKPEGFSGMSESLISGHFVHGENSPLLIQKINSGQFLSLDSVVLDSKGEFAATINIDYPGFYALKNASGDYITILCEGDDTVSVYADYTDFKKYELSGSEQVKEIALLNKATQVFLDKVAIYAAIIRDSSQSPDYPVIWEITNAKYKAAFDTLKTFSENFIQRNDGSLVSLLALTNQLGPNFYVFNPITDKKIFQHVDSVLRSSYPDSEPVKKIHAQLQMLESDPLPEEMRKPGFLAPDFSIQDPQKQIIRLSELSGKTVLLDFWASWSKPGRERNPELLNLYRKYHSRGFEILQISLDKNYKDWTEAISTDGLIWLHGSELKFWDSEIARLYGVSNIPTNFLIGTNGVIIAKNLSPPELNLKLQDLLIP